MLLRLLVICSVMCARFAVAGNYYPVDGDSLEQNDERIRLDGIDAPELYQHCYSALGEEYACGEQALQYLQNLTENREIDCKCLEQKDIYGRRICECFSGEVSLNEAMVAAGWAMTYRDEKYTKAEQDAKLGKRGIWQGKFMRPALYRALEHVRRPMVLP